MNDTRAIAAVRKLIVAAKNVDRETNAVGWGVTWTELDALLDEIHERNQPSHEELEYARCAGTIGLKRESLLDDDLSDHVYRMKKRIEDLETALLDSCREKVLHGHTTTLLSDALRLKVPGVENYEDWADERASRLEKAEARVKELEGVLDGYGARDMEEMSQKLKKAEARVKNFEEEKRAEHQRVRVERQRIRAWLRRLVESSESQAAPLVESLADRIGRGEYDKEGA